MEELNNGSISHTPWLSSSSDENVVITKKHNKMEQESSLSLKLRRKTMNDDIEIDEKDLVMTEVETTTQSVSTTDPLAVRQPKDQGYQSIRRPELAGLFTFSSLYELKLEPESYANDVLSISYRGGFPKNSCSGSFDLFSSHSSDDDLTVSLRGGTPKGECSSPTRSCDSFSSKGDIDFASLAYERCLRAMDIAEKLTMHHHDGMEKVEKDQSMTEPTTGVNTATVTRRNSIDETIILEL